MTLTEQAPHGCTCGDPLAPEGSDTVTLADVPLRTPVTVSAFCLAAADQRRLTELGLRHGVEVEVLRRAPFNGPATLRVAGGLLALRQAQAGRIVVTRGSVRD